MIVTQLIPRISYICKIIIKKKQWKEEKEGEKNQCQKSNHIIVFDGMRWANNQIRSNKEMWKSVIAIAIDSNYVRCCYFSMFTWAVYIRKNIYINAVRSLFAARSTQKANILLKKRLWPLQFTSAVFVSDQLKASNQFCFTFFPCFLSIFLPSI